VTRAAVTVLALVMCPAAARAGEGSCEAESDAVARAASSKGRDPALDPPTSPKPAEHVKTGNRAYRALDYKAAIDAYTAAALVDDTPVIFYNLGQTYRLDHQYEKAIRQYRLFVDRGNPGPELRALVQCHIAMMSAELQQSAATQPPTGPAPDGMERADVTAPIVPAWYEDGVGWAITGGGALAVVTGGLLLVNAAGLDDDADREDRQDVRTALREKADSRRTWGAVVGVAGAVALAVGVVKLAITPDAPAEREPGLSLVIGTQYVGLAGRF